MHACSRWRDGVDARNLSLFSAAARLQRKGARVTALYTAGALIALGLFAYLLYALVRPERF